MQVVLLGDSFWLRKSGEQPAKMMRSRLVGLGKSFMASPLIYRGASHAVRHTHLLKCTVGPSYPLTSIIFQSKYSTKTAPPPPPPPPPAEKNAKGKVLLNRITRAFTFSLSSVIVVGAAGVALLVVYLILSELFLPSGDTRTFNKAVKLVEQNPEAQKLLNFEPGHRLKAHGGSNGDRWVRNRPAHSIRTKGKDGKDRLVMKFYVDSSSGRHGTVSLEQIDLSFWSSEFAYIALDVPGAKRVYIVEPKYQAKNYVPKPGSSGGFLGLKWGPKKE